MDLLVAANLLQRLKAPRSAEAGAEDRYYQSHAPGNRHLLRLVPLVAIVGFLALVSDLVSH